MEKKTQSMYIKQLSEAKKAICEGDVDKLKIISNSRVFNGDFKKYIQIEKNPFRKTNAVILACKANQLKTLEYLLSSESRIIESSSGVISPADQDETHRNAFYYAIRSGASELIQTLISKWPKKYLKNRAEQLDEVISWAYEELKINNVNLSNEIKLLIETQLIDLRFNTASPGRTKNVNEYIETAKERSKIVVDTVKVLRDEFSISQEIDEQCLYNLKFVAQNINVLKQKLKATYDRLPWEEIEFCLIVFISTHSTREKINIYCNASLEDEKIFSHLENFTNRLESELESLRALSITELTAPVKEKRSKVVENIIRKCPEFESLYELYHQLRDLYSLEKISETLKLGLDADVKEREGRILITRMLQVLGEYMKNTLESPKLSDGSNELLLASLPKSARKLILTLRDSFSHTDSLFKRTEIENNMEEGFFHGILKDLRGIGRIVNDMLRARKDKLYSSLIHKITSVLTLDEYKKLMKTCRDNFKFDSINNDFDKLLSNRIKELIEELSAAIPDQTEFEKHMFQQMKDACHSMETPLTDGFTQRDIFRSCLKSCVLYGDRFLDLLFRDIEQLKILKPNLKTNEISDNYEFMKIGVPLINILKSVLARKQSCNDVKRMIFHLLAMMPNSDVKWIEDLEHKLNEEELPIKFSKTTINLTHDNYKRELLKKREELERILNKCRPNSQQLSAFFDVYKRDKKIQYVVEMLVLDIMSIMATLNIKRIGRDFLFVDDTSPVLVGKCLRNHLAHNNELVTLVLDDPNRVIFLNALKLISELDENQEHQRHMPENIPTIKKRHYSCLRILQTKVQMFAACEESKMDGLKMSIEKGADVYSRCREGHGILHFASKGGCIELFKFLLELDQNLSLTAHELEVAVSYGRRNAVELIVSKIGIPDNGAGNSSLLQTASQAGHKDVVEFLLKNKSDPKGYDTYGMPIHKAVMFNHKHVVELLLQRGFNTIDDKAIGGFPSLYIAADYGYIELVDYLLELGANVNAKSDKDSCTPLHCAAIRGHLKVVQALVQKGADVNTRVMSGLSALHLASEKNHLDIVSFLLENDANFNAAGIMCKNTPLHIACEKGYKNIVEVLLQKGADVNMCNADGSTPLQLAVVKGHTEIFPILLAHGSDIYTKTKNHWTLLHCAAKSGEKEMADKLIKTLDVDAKTVEGVTPLHIAAFDGHWSIVEALINNGASVNLRDTAGRTPLHCAASKNHKEIIEKLIRSGAELDVKHVGMSPLCLAIAEDHDDAVTLLIENGAAVTYDECEASVFMPLNMAIIKGNLNVIKLMVSKRNIERKYLSSHAAHLAVKFEHKEILKLLITQGDGSNILREGFNLLKIAVEMNNKAIVELLIESGAIANDQPLDELLFKSVKAGHADLVDILLKKFNYVDKCFENGEPVLLRAAQSGYTKIFKYVIKKCGNVDVASQEGTTALHVAALLGYKEMVEILLDKGANVNSECGDGTPLHVAAANNDNQEIVELLLSRGADMNVEDKKGRIALHMAVAKNRLEIVKAMVSGSRKTFINYASTTEGLTLLHIGAQFGYIDIIKYLIEKGADINIRNKSGSKPIHHAAREGHLDILKFLISKGSSLNETGLNGRTLLHYAAMKGHVRIVEYLIGENVSLNTPTSNGQTPLHFCVVFGFKEVAEMLLNNGAIYNVADGLNKNPRDMALDREFNISDEISVSEKMRSEIVEMLDATHSLLKAVKRNDIADVKKYIKKGAIANARDSKDNMPLHYASWKGYAPIVEVLVHAKANVNACLEDGSTALHYSAKFSHVDIVKMLLSHGAVYNLKNRSKATPLDVATANSIKDVLKLTSELFKYIGRGSERAIDELAKIKDPSTLRAVVNARNEDNKTLLMAAKLGDFPKLNELIQVLFGDLYTSMDRAHDLSVIESYNEALNIYRHVLEQMQVKLGPDNLVLLDIKERIGGVLYKQHKYNEALSVLREVSELQTAFLGPDHLDTMSTKSTIALVFHRQKKDVEALSIYTDIYPKQKKLLKPTSQQLLNTQLHMALVLQGLGMFDEALKLNNEHYEVVRKAKGENDPLTLSAKNNIALVLISMGQHEKAIQTFEEVHLKRRLILGPHHSDTLRPLHNIANVYKITSRYEDAMKRFEEILKIQKKVLGMQHGDTLNTQFNMGHTLFKQGNLNVALKVLKEFLRNAKPVLQPTHPDVLVAQSIFDSIWKILKTDKSKDLLDHLDDMQRNLNSAAGSGAEDAVVDLINCGANVNYVDEDGRSALYYAVYSGKLEIIRVLLKNSADVFQVTNKCNTLLHVAALKGYHEIMEFLLQYAEEEKHVKLNEMINTRTITSGSTPLHVAAKKGSYEIVKSLLMRGAAFDIRNNDGLKPSEVCQNKEVICLFAFVDDIFKNALNGNAVRLTKSLEIGQPDHVKAAIRVRNFQGLTLLQAVLIKCERNVALQLVNKLKNE